MLISGFLLIGSLILGIISWTLPIVSLIVYKLTASLKAIYLSFGSIISCTISLYMVIIYIAYYADVSDWFDVVHPLAFASTVLIIVTIVLNLISLFLIRSEKSK